MPTVRTAFLSSTGKDLLQYREAVYEAIQNLDGWHCRRMENFGARDEPAAHFDDREVRNCDLFIGIVGVCYGSSPQEGDPSFTEREYDAAVQAKKPRLMFIAPDDFPLPSNLIEPDHRRAKQKAFRDRVSPERIRDTFSSPEDLARRVVSAIRNWERQQQAPAAHEGASRPFFPLPPQPYFVHPYPLQANFTGRVRERELLTHWLASDGPPVLALVAIGGMGKSALAWAWANRDVLGLPLVGQRPDPSDAAARCRLPDAARPEGLLWWSFYESGAGFDSFVSEALAYASGGEVDPSTMPSPDEKRRALFALLQKRRILLVLDGLERILRAYTRLDAPYRGDEVEEDARQDFRACADPHAGRFFACLASTSLRARVLITSRLFPRDLDGLPGCRREDLEEFDPEDAVAFFQGQGISGTRALIEEQLRRFGAHPLCLRLLTGLIAEDPQRPGDIAVAGQYNPIDGLVPREHHILQIAYQALTEPKQQLLSRLAAFRFPMDYEAVKGISNLSDEAATRQALSELVARGLLHRSHDAPPRFDLHPIIRQYAYDRLTDREGVHRRLRDYFDAAPKPDGRKVQSLDELQPVIELYHHTVRAGRCDEARDLYRDRLSDPLYFRLSAYLICIELLSALFPDGQPFTPSGEAALPRLKDERAQGWTLNSLANSYGASGQPRRALPLFQGDIARCERTTDRLNLAIGLGNLADRYTELGELAAAESNLRRRIALCREINDELREAIGHSQLSRLLGYQGAWDVAENELAAAIACFEKREHAQGQGIVWAYRTLGALLRDEAGDAAAAAHRARKFADEYARTVYPVERDFVEAEWLLGWAKTALAEGDAAQRAGLLGEAEGHLRDALSRCRRINLVLFEPDILLAWARWHRLMGHREEAREHAVEALGIADRCEYRLCQADIHNFLARLALDAGDRAAARDEAEMARERAGCDGPSATLRAGPPHAYQPALDEAVRLMREGE